jgi:hypothetical protein
MCPGARSFADGTGRAPRSIMQPEQPAPEQTVIPRVSSDAPTRRRHAVPLEDAIRRLWREHRLAHGAKPAVGALVAGGAGLALAMEVGVGELLVGVAASYTVYRMLRYGIGLREALTETVQLQRAAREL